MKDVRAADGNFGESRMLARNKTSGRSKQQEPQQKITKPQQMRKKHGKRIKSTGQHEP
ncbi:hypothetical protein [Methanosarcina horonobensis]|uniref:hypothetical protein n=1 Tax=Methanosarcina horonobensis TaxID=418008 RepID=UPI0013015BD2|nr:hypothetical protein [Methanosarcina horonobensis]